MFLQARQVRAFFVRPRFQNETCLTKNPKFGGPHDSTQRYSTYRTMRTSDISTLGYALLGLIHQKPSSGYDLRRTFAESAMGNYSSSPGAIYLALERLAGLGLIAGEVQASGGLRRRLYRLTPGSETELRKWLVRPIARDGVMRGASDLMLRFAFIETALGVEAAVVFLKKFRAELKTSFPA